MVSEVSIHWETDVDGERSQSPLETKLMVSEVSLHWETDVGGE